MSCNNEPSAEYVYVDYNDGSQVAETLIIKEGKITLPRSPQRSGYDFDGWEANGKVYEYPDTVQVSNGTTITAKWTQLHTVTIDYGIEGLAIVTQSIRHENEFELPTAPTQATKDFKGWKVEEETKQTKDKIKINENVVVKAIWESKATHKVNIEFSNEETKYIILVQDGDPVVLPESMTTRTGYTLSWTSDGESYDLASKVTSDLSIKGIWTPIPYTVTFNSNGGSDVASQTVNYNSCATVPEDPTREGYMFLGWSLNGSNYDFKTLITGDVKLVAQWTSDFSVVSIKVGSDSDIIRTIKVQNNTAFTISTSMGYYATSCVDDKGNSYSDDSITITNNTTFTITKGEYVEYSKGDIGPGGGKIYYINKNYATDGWKYLEAAPKDLSAKYSINSKTVSASTSQDLGSGKSNTNNLKSISGGAAEACANYNRNGFEDWFLPSSSELQQMYGNKGSIGNMTADVSYLSSSLKDGMCCLVSMKDAPLGFTSCDVKFLIRPARCF